MATTQNTYTANGILTQFPFIFPYLQESDVKVSLDGVDQATTEYFFANATTIEFNTAPTNGQAVRIYRVTDTDAAQATFFAGSSIRAQDLNDNNLQLLYATQETVNRRVDSTGGSMTGDLDMNQNKVIDLADPTSAQDASTKAYVDSTIGTAGGYASAAATSASQAAASATAAANSATDAATSETNAGTSETNAATSATNAANSATAASNAQTAAETAETNAETAETNAAASATAAANSATSAATSAASALAAFDNFDDVYLGSFSTANEPTTDNDGDPLNAGDLYFNTDLQAMRVYTGTVWVTAYVPGDAANITFTSGGTLASNNVQGAIEELRDEKVQQTATTGSALLPVGTSAQRDGTPVAGMIRYNTTTLSFEGYGSAWGAIGGGATGGGTDAWALEHDNTITTDYTIGTGKNVINAGPMTINSGVTVTTPSGSTWTIV